MPSGSRLELQDAELETKKQQLIGIIKKNYETSFEKIANELKLTDDKLKVVVQLAKKDAEKDTDLRLRLTRHLNLIFERARPVYDLICEFPGITNKEIASRLGLIGDTVGRHLYDLEYVSEWYSTVKTNLERHYSQTIRKKTTECTKYDLLKLITQTPGIFISELEKKLSASDGTITIWFKELEKEAKTSESIKKALERHKDLRGTYQLYCLLKSNPGKSKLEIAKALGVSTSTVDNSLARLRAYQGKYPDVKEVVEGHEGSRGLKNLKLLTSQLKYKPGLFPEEIRTKFGIKPESYNAQMRVLRNLAERDADIAKLFEAHNDAMVARLRPLVKQLRHEPVLFPMEIQANLGIAPSVYDIQMRVLRGLAEKSPEIAQTLKSYDERKSALDPLIKQLEDRRGLFPEEIQSSLGISAEVFDFQMRVLLNLAKKNPEIAEILRAYDSTRINNRLGRLIKIIVDNPGLPLDELVTKIGEPEERLKPKMELLEEIVFKKGEGFTQGALKLKDIKLLKTHFKLAFILKTIQEDKDLKPKKLSSIMKIANALKERFGEGKAPDTITLIKKLIALSERNEEISVIMKGWKNTG